jgi:hypothetical protein
MPNRKETSCPRAFPTTVLRLFPSRHGYRDYHCRWLGIRIQTGQSMLIRSCRSFNLEGALHGVHAMRHSKEHQAQIGTEIETYFQDKF